MTWHPREHRDGIENDRQADGDINAPGDRSFRRMGRERFVQMTERIKADNEAGRFPRDLAPRNWKSRS